MIIEPDLVILTTYIFIFASLSFTEITCHMKLYLMRHGQAASPQVDPQQGLSREGRTEIEQLANRLSEQGIQFSCVYHSEKTRAQQTAEIMASIITPDVAPKMCTGLKPNDDPRSLIPEIETWQEDTLVTSHLPFVPGLLAELTGQTQSMGLVPGTIICLVKENDAWQIEWVESP